MKKRKRQWIPIVVRKFMRHKTSIVGDAIVQANRITRPIRPNSPAAEIHIPFFFLHYFLVLVDSVPANGICIAHSIHVQLYIVDSVDVSLLHGMGSIGRPLFNGSRQFPVNAFRQHSTLLCTTRDLIAIPTVGTFDNCNACVCFARRSTEDPVIELHRRATPMNRPQWTDHLSAMALIIIYYCRSAM